MTNDDVFTAGIDVGSRTCKGVIVNENDGPVGAAITDTGVETAKNAYQTLQEALEQAGVAEDRLESVVSTGYGRGNVEFADRNVTEITCHARGASFLFPEITGLIDIGGQDSKVIQLDGDGQVVDFSMNDKCAAGTGKFLEVMSDTLEVPLGEMGTLATEAEEGIDLSSVCAVFAESEVISHIHQENPKEEIVAGVCDSVVEQVMGQASRLDLAPPLAMTGGVAKNNGVVEALESELEIELRVPNEPQIVGALGAALIAN